MNRNALGIIAAVLLLLGGMTVVLGPGGNSASGFAGGCIRVGLVLGALWLALPQILSTATRMPGWAMGLFFKKKEDGSSPAKPQQPKILPPKPRRRSNS